MKKYFNRQEREQMIIIALMHSQIGDILEHWKKAGNLTKPEHKNLKTAHTYILKFMDEIYSRYDQKEVKRIIRDLKTKKLALLYESRARVLLDNENTEIELQTNQETIEDIAEGIIDGFCVKCKRKDYEECNVREFLFISDIEKFDPTAKEKCQYKIDI